MKRAIFVLFFLMSLSLGCMLANGLNVKVLSEEQPTCIIRLPSNPTTGYSWAIKDYDRKWLSLKEHRYEAPKTQLVGAGGYEIFKFEATADALETAPHDTKIELIYARPWELEQSQPPIETKIFDIMIR